MEKNFLFKVGDRIIYIEDSKFSGLVRGQTYTVSEIHYVNGKRKGIKLKEFPGYYDWWYDYRFSLDLDFFVQKTISEVLDET